ncbi:putative spermidine/putrescine transport system ATP-binding protein [Bradyrhizobium sp. S3.2.6]|uniref:ABC transporter ATP-binding protein n=1 Tax=Bradyrhizobium sp. S3.2.6 TaxID=3156428 RepID=UPI003394D0C6
MSSTFLELNGICKRYGELNALESVSLDVARGEFLSLLGPSGSGKSTLLAVLAGFAAPDRGCVYLDGEDITHLPPETRRFGVVPQGYGLFPHLTAYENIAFPLRVRRTLRTRIDSRVQEVMELLQIEGVGNRLPMHLSGGQQQRVALARALSFEPDLLLLDEPMSALDASLRRDLQAELVRLHRQVGTTVIHVTHDQQEALALSDRIVVLNRGRAEQVGSPRAIYDRPASRFVASFLGKNNLLNAMALVGADGRLQFHWHGYRIAASPGGVPLTAGPCVLAVRPESITLEAVRGGASHSDDRIRGKVVSRTFLGASTDIVVAIGDNTLAVTLPAAASPIAPGEDAWLVFDSERLWCLPKSHTASSELSAVSSELAA